MCHVPLKIIFEHSSLTLSYCLTVGNPSGEGVLPSRAAISPTIAFIHLIFAPGYHVSAVPCRDDQDHVRLEVGEVIHLSVQCCVRRPNGPPAVGADPSADVVRRLQHLGLREDAQTACKQSFLVRGSVLSSDYYAPPYNCRVCFLTTI